MELPRVLFITLDYQVILLSFCFPLAIHILIMRYMEGRKILLATSVDSKRLSKTLLSLIVYYIIFFFFFYGVTKVRLQRITKYKYIENAEL